MTFNQVQKLSELHAQGWVPVSDPTADPDHLVCGGPAFIMDPNGKTFTVAGDGSLKEHIA